LAAGEDCAFRGRSNAGTEQSMPNVSERIVPRRIGASQFKVGPRLRRHPSRPDDHLGMDTVAFPGYRHNAGNRAERVKEI